MSVSDWFPDIEHSASWMGKWHLFSWLVWENIWCHLEAQAGARCSPVIRVAQPSSYMTASWYPPYCTLPSPGCITAPTHHITHPVNTLFNISEHQRQRGFGSCTCAPGATLFLKVQMILVEHIREKWKSCLFNLDFNVIYQHAWHQQNNSHRVNKTKLKYLICNL